MPPNHSRSRLALEDRRGSARLGVRLAASRPSSALHLGAQRDRLGARARTRRRPWRSWPCRSPASSSAAARTAACARRSSRGAGIGIDEDVAVIEGRHQPDVLRQQHAVAEHVARHVADAHHAERLALDVDVHLAEVALDALPGAARRDAPCPCGRSRPSRPRRRHRPARSRARPRSRWRCRRRWRCPCRRRPPGRDRRRRGAPRCGGGTILPSLMLSVMSSSAEMKMR